MASYNAEVPATGVFPSRASPTSVPVTLVTTTGHPWRSQPARHFRPTVTENGSPATAGWGRSHTARLVP